MLSTFIGMPVIKIIGALSLLMMPLVGIADDNVKPIVKLNTQDLLRACHQNDWTLEKYLTFKSEASAESTNTESEQQVSSLFALQLLNCLASPDASLRDGVAYELLSKWLRENRFTSDTYRKMFNVLTHALTNQVEDEHGVYQPFAALALSEVVRVDRKSPYLTQNERNKVVTTIIRYFENNEDYRGYDAQVGWRHAIAHSADVMLQLALNPEIDKSQLTKMLNAISTQVTPQNNHFYHYGEPKRLAMPVIYIMLQGEHSIEDWQQWLDQMTNPHPFKQWNNVYKSEQGLAKLHNTQAFLMSLYALIKPSQNEVLMSMVPALEQAIKTVN